MSPTPAPTQSAAERRAAEAELQALVARFAGDLAPLAATVRRALRKRLPTATEIVYEYADCAVISFSPNHNGYDGVASVRASARGIDLYLTWGKGLPDPEKLLRGSATQVRFVPIEGAATLRRAAVVRLLEDGIARGRIPFPKTGRGPIIVRSTAAKKRRRT
jgi:hypothetical protein